jgi:hypothetical protein
VEGDHAVTHDTGHPKDKVEEREHSVFVPPNEQHVHENGEPTEPAESAQWAENNSDMSGTDRVEAIGTEADPNAPDNRDADPTLVDPEPATPLDTGTAEDIERTADDQSERDIENRAATVDDIAAEDETRAEMEAHRADGDADRIDADGNKVEAVNVDTGTVDGNTVDGNKVEAVNVDTGAANDNTVDGYKVEAVNVDTGTVDGVHTTRVDTDNLDTDNLDTDGVGTDNVGTAGVYTGSNHTDSGNTADVYTDRVDSDRIDDINADTDRIDPADIDAINVDNVDSDSVNADRIDADRIDADAATGGADAVAVGTASVPDQSTASTAEFWPAGIVDDLRGRWDAVQMRFVDDPSGVATDAKALVGEAVAAVRDAIDRLEAKLDESVSGAGEETDADNDTEQLRQRVAHYRDVFETLLRR